MNEWDTTSKICVVIGASHSGVNVAFALRKEGWQGEIHLFDKDPNTPYHRPPLSKAYLSSNDESDKALLKPLAAYSDHHIQLHLGKDVTRIDRENKCIVLKDNNTNSDGAHAHDAHIHDIHTYDTETYENQPYDRLIIAQGARPFIPPIKGLAQAQHVYPMRTRQNADDIKAAIHLHTAPRVVIIGGGYIGLETAASLNKAGAEVTILEREDRILKRVTSSVMSAYFHGLHQAMGVNIDTEKNVDSIMAVNGQQTLMCSDGTHYPADIIVMGVGIRVNQELAENAGITINNGIQVGRDGQTNDPAIYAIGDCTNHFNPHYDRYVRLESVQNAVEQAKVTAQALVNKTVIYDVIPWFWSDQYNLKLQMVGLSEGFDDVVKRDESHHGTDKFSLWYFKNGELIACDAVNNAKAYIIASKLITQYKKFNGALKKSLARSEFDLKNLL